MVLQCRKDRVLGFLQGIYSRKFPWPWDEDSEPLALRLVDQTRTRLAIQASMRMKTIIQPPLFDSCSLCVSTNVLLCERRIGLTRYLYIFLQLRSFSVWIRIPFLPKKKKKKMTLESALNFN